MIDFAHNNTLLVKSAFVMTHRSFINARRNHSNCSVIELYLTQSNLIERLGSIKFGNRTKKIPVRVRLSSFSELNRINLA